VAIRWLPTPNYLGLSGVFGQERGGRLRESFELVTCILADFARMMARSKAREKNEALALGYEQ